MSFFVGMTQFLQTISDAIVFNGRVQNKRRAGSPASSQPFEYSGRFVSSLVGLLSKGCDFLGVQCLVIYSNIIEQAGEER
jgi:hypothetical protein